MSTIISGMGSCVSIGSMTWLSRPEWPCTSAHHDHEGDSLICEFCMNIPLFSLSLLMFNVHVHEKSSLAVATPVLVCVPWPSAPLTPSSHGAQPYSCPPGRQAFAQYPTETSEDLHCSCRSHSYTFCPSRRAVSPPLLAVSTMNIDNQRRAISTTFSFVQTAAGQAESDRTSARYVRDGKAWRTKI